MKMHIIVATAATVLLYSHIADAASRAMPLQGGPYAAVTVQFYGYGGNDCGPHCQARREERREIRQEIRREIMAEHRAHERMAYYRRFGIWPGW